MKHTTHIVNNQYGKESACNAGDPGSIPGSGRSSGEGNGNPLQYSCLAGYSLWDHRESDTTERLTLINSSHFCSWILAAALVSKGCHNKHQNRLRTTEAYCLTVLKVRSPKSELTGPRFLCWLIKGAYIVSSASGSCQQFSDPWPVDASL